MALVCGLVFPDLSQAAQIPGETHRPPPQAWPGLSGARPLVIWTLVQYSRHHVWPMPCTVCRPLPAPHARNVPGPVDRPVPARVLGRPLAHGRRPLSLTVRARPPLTQAPNPPSPWPSAPGWSPLRHAPPERNEHWRELPIGGRRADGIRPPRGARPPPREGTSERPCRYPSPTGCGGLST
jgi:hypothetical protein